MIMKKYILLLLLALPFVGCAQYLPDNTFGKTFNRTLSFYAHGIPNDTITPPLNYQHYPHLAAKDSVLYVWSPSGKRFRAVGGAASGGGTSYTFLAPLNNDGGVVSLTSLPWSLLTGKPTTLSGYGITDAVNVSDTAAMLFNYMRKGTGGSAGHTHPHSDITDFTTAGRNLLEQGPGIHYNRATGVIALNDSALAAMAAVYSNGYGIKPLGGGVIAVDTTQLATWDRLKKVTDSIVVVVNEGGGGTTDTTSLSNRINLKQNISDTNTVDATRYWVGQQGYAKQQALQDTAAALRSAIGTGGSTTASIVHKSYGALSVLPKPATTAIYAYTVPAGTLAAAGDRLVVKLWLQTSGGGSDNIQVALKNNTAGTTIASRASTSMSALGNTVEIEVVRQTASTYNQSNVLVTSGGLGGVTNFGSGTGIDFDGAISLSIEITTGTTTTIVPIMCQYIVYK